MLTVATVVVKHKLFCLKNGSHGNYYGNTVIKVTVVAKYYTCGIYAVHIIYFNKEQAFKFYGNITYKKPTCVYTQVHTHIATYA